MTSPDVWQLHPLATNVGRQAIVGYEVEALDGVPVLTTGLGLALARVAKRPPRGVRDTGVVLAGRNRCSGEGTWRSARHKEADSGPPTVAGAS